MEPFRWILEESKRAGLGVDPARERNVWAEYHEVEKPWQGRPHESLTWKWWPAEFFPKLRYRRRLHMRLPALGLGRRRRISDDAVPHRSTLEKLRAADLVPAYRPPNVPARWYRLADSRFSPDDENPP